MAKGYWLFKSEPESFSIQDLADSPDQTTCWEGVRNYQARNLLRDEVKVGDGVLFYYSSVTPMGVVGVCEVVKAGYPDATARNPESIYYDPKASPENPRWYAVDVKLRKQFAGVITLAVLKTTPSLEEMMVCRQGARLSIQPVTPAQWQIVLRLASKLK